MVNDATLTSSSAAGNAHEQITAMRVGRYEICELLGAGAMGVVYRAHDPELDRAVAIKLVRDGSERQSNSARLMREAQAMARLRHPNVVPIFDVGPTDNAVFVAMPLLEGGTLRNWLRSAPRTLDAILDRFVAAGRGLAAAHTAGLVHRDFKPENVLLGNDGEVHVADFGLARVTPCRPVESTTGEPNRWPRAHSPGTDDTLTQLGAMVGTPAYMAPEQLCGEPSDARADQFSFCVALWEGVFGERPFGRDSADCVPLRLAAIGAGPRPPHRARPAWIAPLLTRGMAVDPARRWPSMQVLLDAIAAHRRPRRWPWRLAVATVALIAAAALARSATAPADPPLLRPSPLTHRGNLRRAAISPDGRELALLAGDSLVVQGTEPDADDRVIVAQGMADEPILWSPDGHHVLAATESTIAGVVDSAVIDIDSRSQVKLATTGTAVFLSSGEVAEFSFRRRSVSIFSITDSAASTVPSATCTVPGDYVFLWHLVGFPDGTMVVETLAGESHTLVVLGRDCRVRTRVAIEPISSIAASDTGTIVALVAHHGAGEILEITLDGAIASRRQLSGELGEVVGRRGGVDYVSTLSPRTYLVRAHGDDAPVRQFSTAGIASFSLAADSDTIAWVDRDAHHRAHGQLRIASLAHLGQSSVVLDGAQGAGWSPDGNTLAALVDCEPPSGGARPSTSLVVVDRSGSIVQRVAIDHVEREAAPVWLDDHRIAVQTSDRTTYHWLDLVARTEGDLVDRDHGSTYWLARSPRDGTLAMWRNGLPGAVDAGTGGLWVLRPGEPARPLRIASASRYFLVPSWTPSGELLVRTLETGAISRVALDTGELTPIARVPGTPLNREFDDHLMVLPDGDLLAIDLDLGIHVAAVRPESVRTTL